MYEHLDDDLEVHGLLSADEFLDVPEEQMRSGNGSAANSSTVASNQQDYEAWYARTEVGEDEFEKRIEVRPSSLFAWSRKLLKHVLAARTSFSFFVLQCLSQRDRRSFPVATALFPIPLPEMDVWDGPCRFGSSRRKRAAFQRVLQLVVLSINFLHARDPWGSLRLMRRRPSSVHREVYARLMALVKAGGPVEDYSVIGSGRKSAQLDARHSEVLAILQSLGLSEASKYHSGAVGCTVPVVNDRDELVPYRPLNAERIKLTGSANWDCSPYLSDLLYLPFIEPRINVFDILPPAGCFPDVRGSDGQQEFDLCLVWDARSLLHLVPEQIGPKHLSSFTRVFGNYKNHTTDRQIGDRRGQNFREGKISGPSRSLPVMTTLLQLCPAAYEEVVVGSVTDRKDFYHQFQTTPERSSLNAIFPVFPLSAFVGTSAYESFVKEYGGKKRKEDRALRGDHLGGSPKPILFDHQMQVVACFSALFQGDHLGVEFATDSHSNLLSEAGLLQSSSRLRSDVPVADDLVVDGLVIDDYFVLSREGLQDFDVGSSSSVAALDIAKDVYTREGIIGSTEKDIVGALRYKVCGAEVDSSLESVLRGVVSAAVPLDKRMSLAMLSVSVATLPYTSDALHACLVGSWVSTLMMRRPLFSMVNELFKVIPPESLSMDSPELRILPRSAAQELLLLSCLAPIAVSNLAAPFEKRIFATDASNNKGGVVEAPCPIEVVKALWRGADRKGLSVPMSANSSSLLEEYDEAYEILPSQGGYSFGQREAVSEAERPLGLYFDFIEICGGSGVVTAELVKLGVVCGPVFDLSLSKRYDLCNKRVVEWFLYMMEYGRLRSFLVAPPCTSFSPAAFPAVRSYACPRGFDPRHPKVLLGNCLAFIALALLFAGLRLGVAGLGEQPRRSKMRWLAEWRRLVQLGASEVTLASCSYGSPHQKEFGMIGVNIDASPLASKCTRDHEHVKIQGAFTRPSAVYCPGLALAIAKVFARHLKFTEECRVQQEINVAGLESVLSNDLCQTLRWSCVEAWRWKKLSHINILEGRAILRLLLSMAREGGDVRVLYLCDSHVARSCFAKGRSASGSMRKLLQQAAAVCLAFGLYPAGVFAPTRCNPADCPTRDTEFPEPVPHSIVGSDDPVEMRALASFKGLRRWASSWVRLVILLSPDVLLAHVDFDSSWRKHPFLAVRPGLWHLDFDATLGYPGEGPILDFRPSQVFLVILCLLPPTVISSPFLGFALSPLTIISFSQFSLSHGAPKLAGKGDDERKAARAGITLQDGRRVTQRTAITRELLFDAFRKWLTENGCEPHELLFSSPPDLDRLNSKLVEYGRQLFADGKSFYHYGETLNALTVSRPSIRRSLQQAWDLAFIWGSYEPSEHHVAMPFQILVAVLAAAWSWGWKREAASFALAWGALLRIGELLDACRSDLILPSDVGNTIDYVLLKIREPKTRYRSARHQAGKLEQFDLIEVVRIGFSKLLPEEKLWPWSGATLRARLTKILVTLDLPHTPTQVPKALSLASFRPGGATHLIAVSESAEMVRRRGRWASFRTMEMYLQEVAASTYMNEISKTAKDRVLLALRNFPELMSRVVQFDASMIPETTWYFLLYPQCGKHPNGRGGISG